MSENPLAKSLIARLSPIDALAAIEAIDKKRQEEQYVKYWSATEKQKDLFAKFTADKKIFGILGGNRSGKTELGAFIAVAWALGKKYFEGEPAWEYIKDLPIPEPPNTIWAVGLDFPTLRDVIWREKLRFGKNHPPLVPKDPDVVTKTSDGDCQIFFANGSVITGKSAEAGREKFQGASVDLVWIDEEPEVEVFDECYQRTADCAGKILLTLTPLTDIASGVRTPWVFDLHQEFREGKKDVQFVQLSVLDNPYVPEEEKQKLLEKWAGHFEEKARLYGDFIQKSGLVYPMWDRQLFLVKPFRIEPWVRRIVSIDPAATGTTAAVAGAIYPNGDIYLYREYYDRDKVVSEHAKNMLTRFGDGTVDIWLIDPKWSSQRLADSHKTGLQLYRDAGIPVRAAEVGEDYGLNASREYLNATSLAKGDKEAHTRHPKIFIFEDMYSFRHEIEHYTWAFFGKGDQKGLSKDKPVKKNDHLMNCFQYMCAMRPRGSRRVGGLSMEEKAKQAASNSYT